MLRKLHEIYFYPIKSLPGIKLNSAELLQTGLKNDRKWMLVDAKNKFITVRNHDALYDFGVELNEGGLKVSHGNEHIHISNEPTHYHSSEKVKVWESEVEANVAASEINQWFSDCLKMQCRLVYAGEQTNRPINEQWQTNNEKTFFADGYPLLIVLKESLEALEKTTGMQLDPLRFRPNLILSGGQAEEELTYGKLQVGEINIQALKPCVRCVVTTIDPSTKQRSSEPLAALAKQKVNGNMVFGQHAYALKEGVIHRGDEVKIINHKAEPYAPLIG